MIVARCAGTRVRGHGARETKRWPRRGRLDGKRCLSFTSDFKVDGVTLIRTVKDAENLVSLVNKLPAHTVHAWDTEVIDVDLETQSPVGHGKVICASFFSGESIDYGTGPRVWIDAHGEEGDAVLLALRPVLQSEDVLKVWHNYGFDRHVLGNHGLDVKGFHADTMHLARLHNRSRDTSGLGGYSLASLSKAFVASAGVAQEKRPMLDIFGRHKKKKNGENSKIRELPPLEEIQHSPDPEVATQWIRYSTLDAEVTWHLYQRLKAELSDQVTAPWRPAEVCFRDIQFGTVNALALQPGQRDTEMSPPTLYELYHRVIRPFGALLTDMEREGVMVRVDKIEAAGKAAEEERTAIMARFRAWAVAFTGHEEMRFFNLHSDMQKAQLLFGLPRSMVLAKEKGDKAEKGEKGGKTGEKEADEEEAPVIDVADAINASASSGLSGVPRSRRAPSSAASTVESALHPLAKQAVGGGGKAGAAKKGAGAASKAVSKAAEPTSIDGATAASTSAEAASAGAGAGATGPGLVRRNRSGKPSRSAPSMMNDGDSGAAEGISGEVDRSTAAAGSRRSSSTVNWGVSTRTHAGQDTVLCPEAAAAGSGPRGYGFGGAQAQSVMAAWLQGRGGNPLIPALAQTILRRFHAVAFRSVHPALAGSVTGSGAGAGRGLREEASLGMVGAVLLRPMSSGSDGTEGSAAVAGIKKPRTKRAASRASQGPASAIPPPPLPPPSDSWSLGGGGPGMIGMGDSSDSELEGVWYGAMSASDVSEGEDEEGEEEEQEAGDSGAALGLGGKGSPPTAALGAIGQDGAEGEDGEGDLERALRDDDESLAPPSAATALAPALGTPFLPSGGYIPPPPGEDLALQYEFETENTEGWQEPGKTKAKKKRPFVVHSLLLPITERTPKGRASGTAKSIKLLLGKPVEEGPAYKHLVGHGCAPGAAKEACARIADLLTLSAVDTVIETFILPLQTAARDDPSSRVHTSLNLNTETGRLSARRPNLQNQPSLERDRFKIRSAFVAPPGKAFVVADYGQLELRVLAHLTKCKSMIAAFAAGGDFHSRTAMGMYPHVRAAVDGGQVILEWPEDGSAGQPPKPLLKDAFKEERRKAKILNFSIAYGKTAYGLSKDWGVSLKEAEETVRRWYADRPEVEAWQAWTKDSARRTGRVYTLLGRHRDLPGINTRRLAGHMERAAINTPIQGSAADIVMAAMLKLAQDEQLQAMGYKQILQVHDEVILEGPAEHGDAAKARVVHVMGHPFDDTLMVDLAVDAKVVASWGDAK